MKLIYTLFLIICSSSTIAQMTPEEVVQKQLEAYNNRDIDGFITLVSERITFYDYSDNRMTMQGTEACKEFYSDLFEASPKLHSTILTRTVLGNKVIDHERITGRNGHEAALELVLIYEVQNEKIIRITVLKDE